VGGRNLKSLDIKNFNLSKENIKVKTAKFSYGKIPPVKNLWFKQLHLTGYFFVNFMFKIILKDKKHILYYSCDFIFTLNIVEQ